MIQKTLIKYGVTLGSIGIMLGALGAHALKAKLDVNSLSSFETGVKYQIYHALFLLALAAIDGDKNHLFLKKIALLTIVGVVLFSGSIYLLTTQSISGINFKFLGSVTPIGGICLITSWILLGIQFNKLNLTK